MNTAVLGTLAGDVLRPAVVMAVVDGVLAALTPTTRAKHAHRDRAARAGLDREVGRLTEAIATGGPLTALLAALAARQTRRDTLTAAIATRDAVTAQQLNRPRIERDVRQHVTKWRALLSSHVADGRQLLREVLAGPIRFTPAGREYRFEGQAAVGRLLAGVTGLATLGTSPAGFEPVFWP